MLVGKKASFEVSETDLNRYLQVAIYRQQQKKKQSEKSKNYKNLLKKNNKKRTSKNYKILIKMIEKIQAETVLKNYKKNQLSASETKRFFSKYNRLLTINK